MQDGYPEEHELKKIREWPKQDFIGIAEYVKSLWDIDHYVSINGNDIEMHTHGWSGNEEIITELSNTFFWFFCWIKSERGGHHYFKLPEITKSWSTDGDKTA